MNDSRSFSWFSACRTLLCCIALLWTGACATTRDRVEPWIKDGVEIGTITPVRRPDGLQLHYKNFAGQLLRIERCDETRHCLAGQSVVEFEYDGSNRHVEERCLDGAGLLTPGEQGYAIRRWVYSVDEHRNPIIEETFFDAGKNLALTQDGFARKRTTCTGNKIKKIEFFDVTSQPAPSVWLGVSDVVEVQYAYLEGTTEVVYAAFLNDSRKVVARKQLSGQTATTWESGSTYYGGYGGYYHYPSSVPRISRNPGFR